MRRYMLLAVLALGLLGSIPTFAANDHPNLNANAILEQQKQIRSDAESRKGRYKHMSEAKLSELLARQNQVSKLLEGVQVTTELPESQQIELLNALESIEAIANAADDEKMICERYKPVGSNRPKTVCKTVAERRAEREAAQQDMGRRNLECSEATMGPGGCARN